MDTDPRDTILEAFEDCLDAQLRAVRRLRKAGHEPPPPPPRQRMSQVDMAYDILIKTRKPLHITELLERMEKTFHTPVDRESLVSSLSKKVARGDRFVRTDRNTFAVKEANQ